GVFKDLRTSEFHDPIRQTIDIDPRRFFHDLKNVLFGCRIVVSPTATTPAGGVMQPGENKLRIGRLILAGHEGTKTIEPVAKSTKSLRVEQTGCQHTQKDRCDDPPPFHVHQPVLFLSSPADSTKLNKFSPG